MADLIDRQTLMDGYKCMGYDSTEHPEESYMEGWCKGFNSGVEHCIHHLIHAPSVEAEPVRHGHWLRTGRTNVYGGFEVECSVCNDNVMITNIEYEHYCRNCGARMDERSE